MGAAVIIVRHLTKNSAEGNPLYRDGASIGIIGAARSGLLVARDPDDETGSHCILASTKSNLGSLPSSLGYSIQPFGESICVSWTGESPHRASTLLTVPDNQDERTAIVEAVAFLQSILEDGALEAKKVFTKAKSAGFSEKTIRRAKSVAGIEIYHQGFGPGSVWMWHIPVNIPNESPKMAKLRVVTTFGQTADSRPIESTDSPKTANVEGLATYDAHVASFGRPDGRALDFFAKSNETGN